MRRRRGSRLLLLPPSREDGPAPRAPAHPRPGVELDLARLGAGGAAATLLLLGPAGGLVLVLVFAAAAATAEGVRRGGAEMVRALEAAARAAEVVPGVAAAAPPAPGRGGRGRGRFLERRDGRVLGCESGEGDGGGCYVERGRHGAGRLRHEHKWGTGDSGGGIWKV